MYACMHGLATCQRLSPHPLPSVKFLCNLTGLCIVRCGREGLEEVRSSPHPRAALTLRHVGLKI